MKLTIKANNKITAAVVKKDENEEIYSIEIDFDPSYLWSDLEFWLENENGRYCDHIGLNVSKRQKMQTHK